MYIQPITKSSDLKNIKPIDLIELQSLIISTILLRLMV